jgi:hypothetical protein
MKRSLPHKQQPQSAAAPGTAHSIDVKYGLEPVFDPSVGAESGAPGEVQFQIIECPYCGESFETPVDVSAGSARYIEDCQICCQPIEFRLEVDQAGALQSLCPLRGD